MYISEWDTGAAYYYQQLVPQGRNIHRDMAFLHVYIRDLHGAATTTSSLCHKGEIYTQGHGIPPCISEWDLHGAALLPPAACATREKYTPRDMFPPYVYIRMGSTVPP
jgi:hypothetical protein